MKLPFTKTKIPFTKKEDPWIRCMSCGRKIHHKTIWDSKTNNQKDCGDADKPHYCNYCEHFRMREMMV